MKETDELVLFWKEWPSQWAKTSFRDYNGVEYNTAEQYMMAEKARVFNDQVTLQKILAAESPREQKAFGREVAGFDKAIWDAVCLDVVFKGNLFRFSQNADLRDKLLATGTKTLVEASPYDLVWGIGMAEDNADALDPSKWKGLNLLGIALGRVRETIREYQRLDALVGDSDR